MNDHDDLDPMSTVTGIDAMAEAVFTKCRHCRVQVTVMPASGTRHVLGIDHERGCPDFIDEDNMPAAIAYPPGLGPQNW